MTKLLGAGIIINLPLIDACVSNSNSSILDGRQEIILKTLLEFLYPSDGFGPSLEKIKTYDYFIWTITDRYLDPEENKYLLDGIQWIDETSSEEYNKHFEKLAAKEKYELLNLISKKEWGENYFSKVLTVIIESIFADPIYGSNPQGIDWEWFNHNPGQPRPDKSNKYKAILDRKKEDIQITGLAQL